MESAPPPRRRTKDGVRKRAPTACTRCRQQKVRCSGSQPCVQCVKRKLQCHFDDKFEKVLVTKSFLTDLERQAARSSLAPAPEARPDSTRATYHPVHHDATEINDVQPEADNDISLSPHDRILDDDHTDSETDPDSHPVSRDDDQRHLTNPLIGTDSTHTAYPSGRPSYLGTSSNWSFGRRIYTMIHERVYGRPPSAASLLFEGSSYDLGWDGRRTTMEDDTAVLPTADFALFLINAVKFHSGQLFHLFDEDYFMRKFASFHGTSNDLASGGQDRDLWYVHYVLILALGKAFIVRVGKERTPPGADLFVHAMRLLPDITYLCTDPIQSIEILCSAALYLQCIDMRTSAYNLLGQAMRTAVVEGLHTDVNSQHHSPAMIERCREIWWTVYVLDCHMSSLMGTPLALHEQDISARLPVFGGAMQKSTALGIHVQLAKMTASILQTVYSKEGRMDDRFVPSIKVALKSLAKINDERNQAFPINLKDCAGSVSRLGAYLHLFHHTCIMLTVRPLLYVFLQRRMQRNDSRRVSSGGGVRSLLRVCVASAQSSLKILISLQSQGLLESFIPFDLESIWSSSLTLLVTSAVDSTLLRGETAWTQNVYGLLDEMIARGNLVAGHRKNEFELMEQCLDQLKVTPASLVVPHDSVVNGNSDTNLCGQVTATQEEATLSHGSFEPLRGWDYEDGLNGEQLTAIADSLEFGDLDWLQCGPFGQLDGDVQLQ